ncbi:MAG TPA: 30S ribosomal protein S8 [Candidatus Latescibacteria bacterium]|jgi:small subunit ribosomal protein S8|nr:30S ribosomal protein S8 [Candidatus Latescibacterota bacterium]
MTSDPISDMLARIRNALKAGLPSVELPGSRIKGEILRVMKEEGYITNFTMTDGVPRLLSIELKYNDDAEPAIRGMRRESRPGLRKFCGVQEIPNVLGGLGTAVLSTSGGILSGKDARKRKLGGELICTIW